MSQIQLIYEFFIIICTCHECLIDEEFSSGNKFVYQGMSPDEIALVDAAQHLGIVFKAKIGNMLEIDIHGVRKEIELL